MDTKGTMLTFEEVEKFFKKAVTTHWDKRFGEASESKFWVSENGYLAVLPQFNHGYSYMWDPVTTCWWG